jgi:hypothetical protein
MKFNYAGLLIKHRYLEVLVSENKKLDSSVSKVTRCGFEDRVSISGRGRDIYFCHYINIISDPPSAYEPLDTGSPSGVKQPDHEVDTTPPLRTEVRKTWTFTFTPFPTTYLTLHNLHDFTISTTLGEPYKSPILYVLS